MRIVHFSDWHNEVMPLPPADLYVCSGDMRPNFKRMVVEVKGVGNVTHEQNAHLFTGGPKVAEPEGKILESIVDPAREVRLQTEYQEMRGYGYVRKCFGTPDAPVVVCRGNHDFIDLEPMFGGEVYEIGTDPEQTFELATDMGGVTVGGVRGIPQIRGRWCDEMTPHELGALARRLPSYLDILVTHAPPQDILDHLPGIGNIGSPAFAYHLKQRAKVVGPPLRLHAFGHIHQAQGTQWVGETICSNASKTFNIIDLE